MLVNGQLVEVLPVADRGLQYGDGVWETIAIRGGEPRQLEAHLKRLSHGLKVLGIIGLDQRLLEQEIKQITDQQEQCILKIIITRGNGGRGYNPQGCDIPSRILSLHPWPEYPASYSAQGIDLTLCETRLSHNPQLAGFKHLNRLEQVLARAEFDHNYQEGLVRDYDGNVIEATMSNLFVVNQDLTVTTPALERCGIAGIARSCIISELQKIEVEVVVSEVSLDRVKQAKALFLTNSVIQLWPVKQFQEISYEIPDWVRKLQHSIKGIL